MSSSVVKLSEVAPHVGQITMEDRENKNTFSDQLISGLYEAFEQVEEEKGWKVVVLTGYDCYFLSGGTQEGLYAIQDGSTTFIHKKNGRLLNRLPLDCSIPVISAMQGHGIGAGLTFGLMADFVYLSQQSFYTANYMKYGFTPGFGATCVLPEKLGKILAGEMLYSAETYQGVTLEKRGVQHPVLPRDEVLPAAREFAFQLAEKPRISLMRLKAHMTEELREKLPRFIEEELRMHEETFHQPEVKDKIQKLFGK